MIKLKIDLTKDLDGDKLVEQLERKSLLER